MYNILVEKFKPIRYNKYCMEADRRQLKQLFRDNQSLFVALGDESRQKILVLVGEADRLSVGEIATKMGLSRPAVSHHIKVLRESQLLAEHRVGVRRYYYPVFSTHIPTLRQLTTLLEKLQTTIKED